MQRGASKHFFTLLLILWVGSTSPAFSEQEVSHLPEPCSQGLLDGCHSSLMSTSLVWAPPREQPWGLGL